MTSCQEPLAGPIWLSQFAADVQDASPIAAAGQKGSPSDPALVGPIAVCVTIAQVR